MRAPSPPESLAGEALRAMSERGSLLLLSDFDGTLTPIVSTPAGARLAPAVRRILVALAVQPRLGLGLISGRDLRDLQQRADIPGAILAGSHGLAVEGPSLSFLHPDAAPRLEMMSQVAAELRRRLQPLDGVEVEAKAMAVAVHYRRARPSDLAEVFFHVEQVREGHAPLVTAQSGKKVIELLPEVPWNKGECALWIRDRWSQRQSREPATVYLGDDETDEHAFDALRGKALTVRVGPGRRRSAAIRWVEDVPAVHQFLTLLRAGLGETDGQPR
ncbi:MAG: trehalose-phosphatase [Candidatus Rokubacteria bacterium]|nr:trehalose-phosphatase [Candidatus Rokubacteria bacterium]